MQTPTVHQAESTHYRRPRLFGKVEILNPEGTEVYLRRWYILRLKRLFSVRLHHILLPDDDRHPHDHPWTFVSFILRGGYIEDWSREASWGERQRKPVTRVSFHRATDLHQIKTFLRWAGVGGPRGAWTLMFTGPEKRVWGFQVGERWVPWSEYPAVGSEIKS